MLDEELLAILACPKCKSEKKTIDEAGNEKIEQLELEYDRENQKLICRQCRLSYRIEDDIPVMLIDEAEAF